MKNRFQNIRKFQNSGKVPDNRSVWDKIDEWVDAAEIPVAAISLTTGALAAAVPSPVTKSAFLASNSVGTGIDLYQATRNIIKGNYSQAALDGVDLALRLFGVKAGAKVITSTPTKVAAAKAARAQKLGSVPVRQRARYIRTHPSGLVTSDPIVATRIMIPVTGTTSLLFPVARNNYEAPQDNTRVARRVVLQHKQGGNIEGSTKGRFQFRKSQMVKDAEKINGKKDMRKKLVKSDVVTNKKKRIQKGQQGLKFASYKAIETPIYKTEELDPFSDYNFPSTYRQYQTEETTQPVQQVQEQMEKQPKKKQKTQVARVVDHIYKDRSKWISDLKKAYRRAGITNENALRMLIAQDALESGWGKSAQGRFNYGNLTPGSSWRGEIVIGRDKDGKGNPIQQKFRSYNSIDEYAADKVQFLKTLYDFDQNDNIATFTSKLQGGNKGKRRYAAGNDYIQLVTKIYNTSKL